MRRRAPVRANKDVWGCGCFTLFFSVFLYFSLFSSVFSLVFSVFVVEIYALFPQNILDWGADSANFFAFWMYGPRQQLSYFGNTPRLPILTSSLTCHDSLYMLLSSSVSLQYHLLGQLTVVAIMMDIDHWSSGARQCKESQAWRCARKNRGFPLNVYSNKHLI